MRKKPKTTTIRVSERTKQKLDVYKHERGIIHETWLAEIGDVIMSLTKLGVDIKTIRFYGRGEMRNE